MFALFSPAVQHSNWRRCWWQTSPNTAAVPAERLENMATARGETWGVRGENRSLSNWMKLPLKMQKRHNSYIDDLNKRNACVCVPLVCALLAVIYSKACEMSNFGCSWLCILLSNNFLGFRYLCIDMCVSVWERVFCILVFIWM